MTKENPRTNKVYLSYKNNHEVKFISSLTAACMKRNIDLLVDDWQIDLGKSIGAYMTELSRGGVIVAVISEPYLESRFCMRELCDAQAHGYLEQRVIFIRCLEKYNSAENKHDLKTFWERKARKYSDGEKEECKRYAAEIVTLIDKINDQKEQSLQACQDEAFSSLLARLEEKIAQIKLLPLAADQLHKEELVEIASFKARVRTRLDTAMQKPATNPLKEKLKSCLGGYFVNKLVSEPNRLSQLKWAVQACVEEQAALAADPDFYHACMAVMGNLLLLTVEENAAARGRLVFTRLRGALTIYVAVSIDECAEIIVSALSGECTVGFQRKNNKVVGKGSLLEHVKESGWTRTKTVDDVIDEIFQELFPGVQLPSPTARDRRINEALEAQFDSRSPRYLAIRDLAGDGSPLGNRDIRIEIVARLHQLTLLFLTDEEHSGILLKEGGLRSMLLDILNLFNREEQP